MSLARAISGNLDYHLKKLNKLARAKSYILSDPFTEYRILLESIWVRRLIRPNAPGVADAWKSVQPALRTEIFESSP